jgi:hypothetical protein
MPAVENSPAIKRKVAEIKTVVLEFEDRLIAVILLGSMFMRIGGMESCEKAVVFVKDFVKAPRSAAAKRSDTLLLEAGVVNLLAKG